MKVMEVTCDGDDVQQPPHRLWADVAEPILRHHQLRQVERHLTRHRALHLAPPVRFLESAPHRSHDHTHEGRSIFTQAVNQETAAH